MDAPTLAKVMTIEGHTVTYSRVLNKLYFDKSYGGPSFRASVWMTSLNQALVRARCTTSDRVAMFLAQLGAESGSFRYTEELASGAEYNWRSDLGNNYAGDGQRFKGRTYIQITGRHNYAALSSWAHAKGYVPTSTYFVDHPYMLADVKYIFLGPVWYWTVARNMNPYSDRHDIEGATRAVNGGLNNLSGRRSRWNYARQFGNRLLPTGSTASAPRHAAPVTRTVSKPTPTPIYTVRPGDTLTSIARAHHTTWRKLQQLNGIKNPNSIVVGQRIRVTGSSSTKIVSRTTASVFIKVQSGDTLGRIAARHGTTWQRLQKMNNLKNPNVIFVGQRLRVR